MEPNNRSDYLLRWIPTEPAVYRMTSFALLFPITFVENWLVRLVFVLVLVFVHWIWEIAFARYVRRKQLLEAYEVGRRSVATRNVSDI